MIDTLPLDLFGEDEPEATSAPAVPAMTTCPWCAAVVAPDAATCPACEARILPSEPPAPPAHDGICQWCGAAIASEIDTCPACGWDAHGDNEGEIPGITTALSESQIRSLYGGPDEPQPDTDDPIAPVVDLVVDIIGVFLKGR